MKKLDKKASKKDNIITGEDKKQCLPLYGVFGIIALFVFASITYSTILICLTYADSPKYVVGLAPQVLFAVWLAIFKFSSK